MDKMALRPVNSISAVAISKQKIMKWGPGLWITFREVEHAEER